MKSTIKKQKDGKVKLVVEVDSELVETRYKEVMRDFQRQARLPGFREGKAPIEMVEKRYSKEAEEELLKVLIPEAYHRTIREKNISPVSLPSISEIKLERGKKLSFSAEFEESPEVNIKNYKGIRIKRASSEVTDGDLEKAFVELLDAHADLVPLAEPRLVQKDDFVSADVESWQKGVYTVARKDVLLRVDKSGEDDFFEQIIGTSIGETREISRPSKEGDTDVRSGRVPYVRILVQGIKEKKLPAADDEFAKRFGKETLEELKKALRKELSSHKHSESLRLMKAEVFQKLLAMVSMTPPIGVVERQRERLEEQIRREGERGGLGEEPIRAEIERRRESLMEEAARQVKIYFILRKISETEDIEADEVELEKRLEGLVRESQRPIEEVRSVFGDDLRESMREQKVVDFLIAHAQFDEK